MGLGDRDEMKDVCSAWGARRQRIELRPSKRDLWRPFVFLFWFGIIGGLVAVTVMMVKRSDKEERLAAAEGLAAPAAEPQEPMIAPTEVSAGVYHLDFGGHLCGDANCIGRASALVLERAPDRRIVSIAPIGAYGSPDALIIVTVPIPH